MKLPFVFILSVTLLLAIGMFPAKAQVLLIVNDSNLHAVTFTATSTDPSVSDATHTFNDGVDLDNFDPGFIFTSGDSGSAVSTTLTTPTSPSDQFNTFFMGDTATDSSTPFAALNLYSGSDDTMTFNSSSTAFTGTATFDLSTVSDSLTLPSNGTIGALYAGDTGSAAAVQIGQWEVINTVPEPDAWILMLAGAFALVAVKSRWRRA